MSLSSSSFEGDTPAKTTACPVHRCHLALERKEPGYYLTGAYVCQVCGARALIPRSSEESPYNSKPTVLIIEGDALVRAMIYESLTAHGYTAVACANREDALTLLEKHSKQVHLILTDISVLGKEELQELLPAGGKDCPTKILLTSGNVFCRDMQNIRRELACHFLQKPFTASELLMKIAEIFLEV